MKRARWFVAGAVAGVSAGRVAKKRVQAAAERYEPVAIARRTVTGAKTRVTDAVREGRNAMRSKEAELRGDQKPIDTSTVDDLDSYRRRRAR